MNLGKVFWSFLGKLSFAFALKQAVATLDETVIRENWDSWMCLKNYFKGFPGSFEVGSESIVDLLSVQLV
jgi:hypothetical protein